MIRWLAIVLFFALASAAGAGSGTDALDREDGFRGARFGAPLESFPDMELISERGARGTKLYVRQADELALGDAALDGVTYGFWRGELYFVAIFTSGKRNATTALERLQRDYGPGSRVPGEALEYVWRGERVVLHFRQDPVTAMGMVGLTSVPIDRKVKQLPTAVPAAPAP